MKDWIKDLGVVLICCAMLGGALGVVASLFVNTEQRLQIEALQEEIEAHEGELMELHYKLHREQQSLSILIKELEK